MSLDELLEDEPDEESVTINRCVLSWRKVLQELGYSEDDVRVQIVRAPEDPTGWGIFFSSPNRETMEAVAELLAAYEEDAEDGDDKD